MGVNGVSSLVGGLPRTPYTGFREGFFSAILRRVFSWGKKSRMPIIIVHISVSLKVTVKYSYNFIGNGLTVRLGNPSKHEKRRSKYFAKSDVCWLECAIYWRFFPGIYHMYAFFIFDTLRSVRIRRG